MSDVFPALMLLLVGLVSQMGHEDRFQLPRLSSGYRLGQPTFAGTHSRGRSLYRHGFCRSPIEFAALAQALGMPGHRVETPPEFKTAYAEALGSRESVLLE